MTARPVDLAATHDAAFRQARAWSAAEFAEILGTPGVILCGDVRSFLVGRVVADEAEVLTVATHPDFQRKGLAAGHLGRFLAAAEKAGAGTVFLEVNAANTAAKALYSYAGFGEAGRRKAYYAQTDGPPQDALILRKTLVQGTAGQGGA